VINYTVQKSCIVQNQSNEYAFRQLNTLCNTWVDFLSKRILSCIVSLLVIMLFTLLEFFPSCLTYDPPLPITCLISIWTNVVGCSAEGYAYPAENSRSLLGLRWDDKNQRSGTVISVYSSCA